MTDLTQQVGVIRRPALPQMGILRFVWRHIWLVIAANAAAKERTIGRPVEVIMEDETCWHLIERKGVIWHLHHPAFGGRTVTSARIARVSFGKWDHKS